MKGVYTAATKIAGVNSARTLAYLTAPANKTIEIIGVTVTDESVATNFQMEIAIANSSTLGRPTTTQSTPPPQKKGAQAAAAQTFSTVTASEPTYGTPLTKEGAAAVQGYRHEPYPDERLYVAPGQSIGVRLQTTP